MASSENEFDTAALKEPLSALLDASVIIFLKDLRPILLIYFCCVSFLYFVFYSVPWFPGHHTLGVAPTSLTLPSETSLQFYLNFLSL